MLRQIVRHMTEQLVLLDMYFTADVNATSKRLHGVQVGGPWNVHEWDLK